MFIHVKNAILTCVLVVRTILSLLRIDASMPLQLSAVIQLRMIFFFFSLKNMFMHVKNAILTRALVGRMILSLLRINSCMLLQLSAVIQSMMIYIFFSEKHVYTCKKRDFNACARCSSGYVTA